MHSCEQLKELEKINCFNELDSIIMEKEILKTISHIKSNKSPGLDNISNDMIKHSQTFFIENFSDFLLISAFHPEFIQTLGQMDT